LVAGNVRPRLAVGDYLQSYWAFLRMYESDARSTEKREQRDKGVHALTEGDCQPGDSAPDLRPACYFRSS
jgi:hypothetical protein